MDSVLTLHFFGEVSEWLKEHAWKACVRESVPRVRIPLSPHPSIYQTRASGFSFLRTTSKNPVLTLDRKLEKTESHSVWYMDGCAGYLH